MFPFNHFRVLQKLRYNADFFMITSGFTFNFIVLTRVSNVLVGARCIMLTCSVKLC